MIKKNFIIVIGIAILFALFVGYGIEVFDPAPKNEEFCRQDLYEIQEQADCEEAGGLWQGYEEVAPVTRPKGFCNAPYKCYDEFSQAQAKHDKIVFIVAIIIGILGVITGVILKKDVVSTGITAGSVLLILYGTIRYWQYANNTLKFILLGIALAVLIWLAYKKLTD
ncbi:MAG: hypothetical protein Q8Q01_01875 [archaeon]|nr:hypothetical protein [archaeon]